MRIAWAYYIALVQDRKPKTGKHKYGKTQKKGKKRK